MGKSVGVFFAEVQVEPHQWGWDFQGIDVR